MAQETSENEKKTVESETGAADSGQPSRPKGPASTTVRAKPGVARATVNRPGGPAKKSYGVELAMGLLLAALVLGIAIVFLATSASSSNKGNEQATPTVAVVGELSPRNAATAQAVISKVANQDLSTPVPLPPTPSGSPVSSNFDAAGKNWPSSGGNPARTRAVSTKLNFPLNLLWKAQLGGELQASPAIANGTAYVGSSSGAFYAVDLSTGKTRWSRQYTAIGATAAVAGNTVYFGTLSGMIYALDTATGQERWNYPSIEKVLSSPVVVDGVVYIGSNLGTVWGIDANTGQRRLSLQIGMPNGDGVNTSPAYANGVLYFGANNGTFYAENLKAQPQPDVKWPPVQPDPGNGILSSPAVADGIVYFANEKGKLYAYDAATGQKKWSADLGGPSRSSPAVANGVVYIGSSNKKVYAFDAATGTKKWEFTTGEAVFSSPAVAGDTVLVGSNDTHLYALDAATGQKKWDYQTEDLIGASPVVADGKVYITSLDGRLYAFGQ